MPSIRGGHGKYNRRASFIQLFDTTTFCVFLFLLFLFGRASA